MTVLGRLAALIRAELQLPVPPQLNRWHYLGGMVIFLLAIEIISGILLMVYYRPSIDEAYESVRYIMNHVQLGWLIRGIHRFSADLLILTLLVHLLRISFQGACRERELNWAIGLVLLLFTGAFVFTGTLLVWDQAAFWSTDAVRQILHHLPVLGHMVLNFLWGGPELEAGALLRFYVFHVGLLPWLTVVLVAIHLYFVSRQGLFGTTPAPTRYSPRTYGDLILDGLPALLFTFGILLTLAVLFAPTLGERADPLQLVPAKTDWYFLPIYGLFRGLPGSWEMLALGLGFLGLFFVPMIERRWSWIARALTVGIVMLAVLLGLFGFWSGGLR